jgi:hypothetical protein
VDRYIRNASAIASTTTFETGAAGGAHKIAKDNTEREGLELMASNLRTDDQRMKAIDYLTHIKVNIPKAEIPAGEESA